jgi:hypothetical protein
MVAITTGARHSARQGVISTRSSTACGRLRCRSCGGCCVRCRRAIKAVACSNVVDILDALAAEEAGEVVDWGALRVSPGLAAALDDLDDTIE